MLVTMVGQVGGGGWSACRSAAIILSMIAGCQNAKHARPNFRIISPREEPYQIAVAYPASTAARRRRLDELTSMQWVSLNVCKLNCQRGKPAQPFCET